MTAETDEVTAGPKVRLKLNETLKLYCKDVENDVFKINWYKDGHRLLESADERITIDGRSLEVESATKADAGEYLCAVEVTGLSYPTADHQGYVIQVTYPAEVKRFPPQIRPILGRNMSLECRVEGYPIPRITWFVDDLPADFFSANNSRLQVLDNADGLPGAVLFLEDVAHGDDHRVTCLADNKEGFMESSVFLAVRENMINTNEEIPGKGIVLNLGSDLVLQCNTTDDPSLNVAWYKNGNTLNMTDSRIHVETSNNTLVIHSATEADTGSYMCVASSEELINATIVVRTKVKLYQMDSSRNIVQGQNIVLTCNVTQGIPLPTLQWYKDGESLNLSDSRIEPEDDMRGILNAKLIIHDASFSDRAQYTCVATNDVGSTNTTILIRVKDKYAALWPFLGICAEVAILCTIIFVYEKKRQKPDFDESETDHTTENKTVPDQEDKSQDIRQRK